MNLIQITVKASEEKTFDFLKAVEQNSKSIEAINISKDKPENKIGFGSLGEKP